MDDLLQRINANTAHGHEQDNKLLEMAEQIGIFQGRLQSLETLVDQLQSSQTAFMESITQSMRTNETAIATFGPVMVAAQREFSLTLSHPPVLLRVFQAKEATQAVSNMRHEISGAVS